LSGRLPRNLEARCLAYGPGEILYNHAGNAYGFHFYCIESAMAYHRTRIVTNDITMQGMIRDMRSYNFFFISYRARNYYEGRLEIQEILAEFQVDMDVLFCQENPSGEFILGFYCRLKFNGRVQTVEQLWDLFRNRRNPNGRQLRSLELRVRHLEFPFEISKALITKYFFGRFRIPRFK